MHVHHPFPADTHSKCKTTSISCLMVWWLDCGIACFNNLLVDWVLSYDRSWFAGWWAFSSFPHMHCWILILHLVVISTMVTLTSLCKCKYVGLRSKASFCWKFCFWFLLADATFSIAHFVHLRAHEAMYLVQQVPTYAFMIWPVLHHLPLAIIL